MTLLKIILHNHMDIKRIEELKQIHSDYLRLSEKYQREYMRNKKGMDYEKNGKIEEAIAMYELNVDANFEGLHPYKRLAILYDKLKLSSEAERVLKSGIRNVAGDNHRQELASRLLKIETKA